MFASDVSKTVIVPLLVLVDAMVTLTDSPNELSTENCQAFHLTAMLLILEIFSLKGWLPWLWIKYSGSNHRDQYFTNSSP